MDPELDVMCSGADAGSAEDKSAEEVPMSPAIAIMQPILRFLQLLCENHNRELQVSLCAEAEEVVCGSRPVSSSKSKQHIVLEKVGLCCVVFGKEQR